MQKAYQALKVISEAQTVHIILASQPGELMLTELINTCEGLHASRDDGIKAVILDFVDQPDAQDGAKSLSLELLSRAGEALHAVPQPVLAVVRAGLSRAASQLIEEGDLTLFAYEASLLLPTKEGEIYHDHEIQRVDGLAAQRLGRATWTAKGRDLNRKLESILDMLRAKSAVALRSAKAAARLGQQTSASPSESLRQVNQFYLENALPTEDAREGMQAFLEKRLPRWKNH